MLKEKIEEDYHLSQKENNQEKKDVFRLLLASIHNKEIELRAKDKKLEDEDVLLIIRAEVKKRKEAIFLFKKGNREDLAEKEEKAIVILQSYLPQELTDEEIDKIILDKMAILKVEDLSGFGKIMGEVMKEIKGKAEGTKVAEKIKNILKKTNE